MSSKLQRGGLLSLTPRPPVGPGQPHPLGLSRAVGLQRICILPVYTQMETQPLHPGSACLKLLLGVQAQKDQGKVSYGGTRHREQEKTLRTHRHLWATGGPACAQGSCRAAEQ